MLNILVLVVDWDGQDKGRSRVAKLFYEEEIGRRNFQNLLLALLTVKITYSQLLTAVPNDSFFLHEKMMRAKDDGTTQVQSRSTLSVLWMLLLYE